MEQRIEIISNIFETNELLKIFSKIGSNDISFSLEDDIHRGIDDPAILIAIVTSISTVLSSIIVSLFKIFEKKQIKDCMIIIEGENGKIQIPSNSSEEQIKEYLSILNKINANKIIIGH